MIPTTAAAAAAPTAGLLAAAAGTHGHLTEAEYRASCERHPEWTPADELIESYGSFGAALEAAGIGG